MKMYYEKLERIKADEFLCFDCLFECFRVYYWFKSTLEAKILL